MFAYNDYHSLKINGTQWPTLAPPLRNTSQAFIVTEAVGSLSGPYHFYSRKDNVSVQQSQAIAHALVHNDAHSNSAYCGLVGWYFSTKASCCMLYNQRFALIL